MSFEERTGTRHLYFSRLQHLFGTQGNTIPSRSKMVDIDGGFYCEKCYDCLCGKCRINGDRELPGILCYVEDAIFDNGKRLEGKCAKFLLRTAQRAGVPAYKLELHLDKARNDDDYGLVKDPFRISTFTELEKIVVQCIYPESKISAPVTMTPEEVEDFFMGMLDEHEKVCNHPTGMRWDRELRRDVPKNGMTQAKKASM